MCIDLLCLSPAFVEDSSFPIDDASVLESTNPRSRSDESRGKQRVALTSLEEEIPATWCSFPLDYNVCSNKSLGVESWLFGSGDKRARPSYWWISVVEYPLVNGNKKRWKDPPCLMGKPWENDDLYGTSPCLIDKSTLSTGPLSIAFC